MKIRFGTLLLLLVPLAAHSAPRNLSLAEAVATAVQNNLSLERSLVDLEAKQRQNAKAWNVFVPSLSTAATWSASPDTTNSITGADVVGTSTLIGTVKVGLTLPGNILVSLDAAALNYRTGKLGYDLARRAVEKNVRLAYNSLLLSRENLRVTRDSLTRAEQNLAKVQANYKAGLVPELDVLSAQVNVASLRPNLTQLEAAQQNSLGQFKVLLGLDLDEEVALVGDLLSPIEKRVGLASLDQSGVSPDVLRSQLSVETAELSAKSQQLASWLPAVSLSWTGSPTLLDAWDQAYAKRPAKDWQNNGSLQLTLSYTLDSLFPWSGSHETLLQAEDQVTKARSQLTEAKTSSELIRRNLVRSIDQAVQSLASLELNVDLARKTYELTQVAYQRGARDLLAVQGAEGDLDSARYRVLAQRATLLANILSLEDELNLPFGTILKENS